MVAVKNHITDNKSLLSFHKGDIICLRPMEGLGNGESWSLIEGWQEGRLDNSCRVGGGGPESVKS